MSRARPTRQQLTLPRQQNTPRRAGRGRILRPRRRRRCI